MYTLRLTASHERLPDGTLTHLEDATRSISNLLLHVRKFQNEKKFEFTTCGVEELDKCGDKVPRHIHFHFVEGSPNGKNPLRNYKDWWRKQNLDLKGNKVWSLTYTADPDDWNRLFRYPLKEKPYFGTKAVPLINVPKDFNLENEMKIAQAERIDSQKRNKAYYQKKNCKETMADRIFKYLGKELKEVSHYNVWEKILEFYIKENKPICFKTIDGYTNNWLVRFKWLTPKMAYALNSQNKNIVLCHNGISPQETIPSSCLEKTQVETEKQKTQDSESNNKQDRNHR